MSRKISWLALVVLCLSTLSIAAATDPAKSSTTPPPQAPPAAAADSPAAAPTPAWLEPSPNQSVGNAKGKGPQGALFLNGCSSACLADYSACNKGCNGNHLCIQLCNNDYYCCLDTCNPRGPQCP